MRISLLPTFIAVLALQSSLLAQETPIPTEPTPTPTATATPEGKLDKVCAKVRKGTGGFIYKNSAPLRSGGPGTPLVGFRKEPTLIGLGAGSLSRNGTVIYDILGNKLGSCPWTTAHGAGGGRYRCTMSTISLRRKAIRKSRKPTVYFKLVGKSCIKIPDAGRCYGSVKGLCNQLIK